MMLKPRLDRKEHVKVVQKLVHDDSSFCGVEYLDYQISVTQLKGPKGNGDMQAANRD